MKYIMSLLITWTQQRPLLGSCFDQDGERASRPICLFLIPTNLLNMIYHMLSTCNLLGVIPRTQGHSVKAVLKRFVDRCIIGNVTV